MSECSIQAYNSGKGVRTSCERCGNGPCEVWRGEPAPFVETVPPPPPSGGATEIRQDPAYAAALSEQSILVDARARAFGLAIERCRPVPGIAWPLYAEVEKVSNEILSYILTGGQP